MTGDILYGMADGRSAGADVLAIVGSTKFDKDHLAMLRARQIIEGALDRQRPDLIVSGGAVGIDSLAEIIAEQRRIPFREFPPKYRRWAPEGFKERNLQIADACTRLLCIRARTANTYGSGWTADRAEEMGKLVWRVTL